jgi:hypothetical protein
MEMQAPRLEVMCFLGCRDSCRVGYPNRAEGCPLNEFKP